MTERNNITRAEAFNTVANLLAGIDDADLRQLLGNAITVYGATCAQQVLDSWTSANARLGLDQVKAS